MNKIRVHDKDFELSIPADVIRQKVCAVAESINRDFCGESPLFLVVLNGAFVFAADLLRQITLPNEVSFVKLSSYDGLASSGCVKEVLGLNVDISGRPVIIVEDIVETGLTLSSLIQKLRTHCPKSIDICTLLLKPERLQVDMEIKYIAMTIPNDFILGYGLDYNGQGRGLKDIYTLLSH